MSEEEFLELAHEVKVQTRFDRSVTDDTRQINPKVRKKSARDGHDRSISEFEAEVRRNINEGELRDALQKIFRDQKKEG